MTCDGCLHLHEAQPDLFAAWQTCPECMIMMGEDHEVHAPYQPQPGLLKEFVPCGGIGADECASLLHPRQTHPDIQLPQQNPCGLLGQVQW